MHRTQNITSFEKLCLEAGFKYIFFYLKVRVLIRVSVLVQVKLCVSSTHEEAKKSMFKCTINIQH